MLLFQTSREIIFYFQHFIQVCFSFLGKLGGHGPPWPLPLLRHCQRVAHIAQVTCFKNIVRIRRLIYPNFLFARHIVEMIVLPQSIVSLGEAMYQSAFLSLEFRLNSELVSSVAKHKF